MKWAKRRWLTVISGLGLAAATAQASVPRRFSVQGKLTGYGAGPVDLQVRFYAASAGGAALGGGLGYCDYHPGTALANGVFTIVVGGGVDCSSFAPNGAIPAAALDPAPATTLWMELTVNGTPLPRERVWAVPFSIASITAESLVAPDTFTQAAVVDAFSNVDFVGDISTPQKVLAASIGIGDNNPLAQLHIQGVVDLGLQAGDVFNEEDAIIEGSRTWLGLHMRDAAGSDGGILFSKHDPSTGDPVNLWSMYRQMSTDDLRFGFGTGSNPLNAEVMRLTSEGNVGIGGQPSTKMHVTTDSESTAAPIIMRLDSSFRSLVGNVLTNRLEFAGSQIRAIDVHDSQYGTLALNPLGGSVSIGGDFSREGVTLDVTAETIELGNSDIDNDDIVVEAQDAWLGLYSSDDQNFGSGIALGEIASGDVSKWAMFRTTSNNGSELRFSYGTDAAPSNNASVLKIKPDGTTVVKVLEITGADLAERFPVSDKVQPGHVVEIDPDNPGQLRLSCGAYSRRVAGVVSGAGDLPVGAILGNLLGQDSAPPIALSGRVWVYCDASEHPIESGDLLTTSDWPGHAAKALDFPRAQGAIIGKAMTALDSGQGLVLVLVNLQ
jgi:hypothetical protein